MSLKVQEAAGATARARPPKLPTHPNPGPRTCWAAGLRTTQTLGPGLFTHVVSV